MAETSIVFDYEISEVRIFTDRPGTARQIIKRLNGKAEVTEGKIGDRIVSWSITVPMEFCRNPFVVTKVLAGDSPHDGESDSSWNDGEPDSDWGDRVEDGEYDPILDEVHSR